jgi:hypothetical protein
VPLLKAGRKITELDVCTEPGAPTLRMKNKCGSTAMALGVRVIPVRILLPTSSLGQLNFLPKFAAEGQDPVKKLRSSLDHCI